MADITSKVKEIIVDKLGVDAAEVTPEASFTKDLGADSLDTVDWAYPYRPYRKPQPNSSGIIAPRHRLQALP